MLTFEPPALREKFERAIDVLEEWISIGEFYDFSREYAWIEDANGKMVKVVQQKFPVDTNDIVTSETPLPEADLIRLNDSSDLYIDVGILVNLASLVEKNVKISEKRALRLDDRTIIYVEAGDSYESVRLIETLGKENPEISLEKRIDGDAFRVSLLDGSIEFSLLAAVQYGTDEHFPPHFSGIAFVEVEHPRNASPEVVHEIATSFLFELATSGFPFKVTSFPTPDDVEGYYDEDRGAVDAPLLRPVSIGKGLRDLHSLYVAGCSASPSEFALIHFVKVVEYVSATVVRLAKHDALRKRLSSKASLAPSAEFLNDLAQLIEDQRAFSKDHEALRLTVKTCCDATLLASHAPAYLKDLKQIAVADRSGKDFEALCGRGLDQLAATLSATRNQLSHAKANYALSGSECPADQLRELVVLSMKAAEQVIRWYGNLPDANRVV